MKYKLEKASDWDFEEEVEINTLEELLDLVDKYGSDIVVRKSKDRIIIYDGYLE